jgi:hypothetical protein
LQGNKRDKGNWKKITEKLRGKKREEKKERKKPDTESAKMKITTNKNP